jgi:hypothetical protein
MLNLQVATVHREGIVRIRLVQSAWNERTVTFATRPAISSADIDTAVIVPAQAGQVVSFDVSAAVAMWRASPSGNFGLAINATGGLADVYFGTRESGRAPTLSAGGVARDNDVTVSKSGGDYSDPVVAAENAFEGDRWCTPSMQPQPCMLRIDSGIFALERTMFVPEGVAVVGKGIHETILANRGGSLSIAVRFVGPSISDLAIVNRSSEGVFRTALTRDEPAGATFSTARVARVHARAEGPGRNTAISGGDTPLTIVDSHATAMGGEESTGIFLGFGAFRVVGTTVHAAGGSRLVHGIEWGTDDGGTFILEDSTVVASGPDRVIGVMCSAEVSECRIDSSRIMAVGTAPANVPTGVAVDDFGATMFFTDSTIVSRTADGQPGTGVTWFQFPGESAVFDGLDVEGSVELAADVDLQVSVLRSQFTTFGIFTEAGFDVTVEQSILAAGSTFRAGTGGRLQASDSVLGAPRSFTNVEATCDEVYDENLRALEANCSGP